MTEVFTFNAKNSEKRINYLRIVAQKYVIVDILKMFYKSYKKKRKNMCNENRMGISNIDVYYNNPSNAKCPVFIFEELEVMRHYK